MRKRVKIVGDDKLRKVIGFYPSLLFSGSKEKVFVLGYEDETIEVKEKDILKGYNDS